MSGKFMNGISMYYFSVGVSHYINHQSHQKDITAHWNEYILKAHIYIKLHFFPFHGKFSEFPSGLFSVYLNGNCDWLLNWNYFLGFLQIRFFSFFWNLNFRCPRFLPWGFIQNVPRTIYLYSDFPSFYTIFGWIS